MSEILTSVTSHLPGRRRLYTDDIAVVGEDQMGRRSAAARIPGDVYDKSYTDL
jgi:hypothetical protein